MFFVLSALLATDARADRYWDIRPEAADAMVKALPPGTIVVTWCQQCGGDLRILRVRAARSVPGTYAADEGRRSILLDRALLFAGANLQAPALPASAACGATPAEWIDPVDGTGPGPTEHLDIPYSFVLDAGGGLSWLGAPLAAEFGQPGPPKIVPLPADFFARVRACAADAAAGKLPPPPQR